ncbi:MAG TPA: sigma-70 family RNA polymerase sigma factor [Clostridiaceae bacterium]|jgi:RNA polymerase sigma-70 factor (ECF subfamily)|nr:sigma-70 family RNA polymerase sigma factor [Clostridiaceae bacterium]
MDELINRSKKGDEEAFTELILSIKNDLYKIAKTRLNNDYEINDAIQETIIKSYNHLRKLKDNSKFKSWIIKILINECNTIYKKKCKKKRIIDKILMEDNFNNTDNSIENSDSVIDFNILLESLNYEEKIIITLFYNNRFTCSEISQILNINVNTVKSKLSRTKEKIKKSYKGGVFYE